MRPTVTEIEALGAQALGVACDVSREEDTLRLATETLARFGRIDVLVNNAALYGVLERRPFMEIPLEEVVARAKPGSRSAAPSDGAISPGLRYHALAPGVGQGGHSA